MGGMFMKKKLVSTLCASALILTGGLTLSACGKDEAEAKVMNVSLNPEVEFVLDKDNKVLSVNALNDEGNLIISSGEFVNKDANEAVQLFISISKENGYLVSGSVSTDKNKLEVQISGESTKEIDKLYESVKASVETKLQELNITGTIEKLDNLTREYLEGVMAEVAPYLEKAQIEAMKYDELINEIKKSRIETKEYYSQELKEMYYQAKADALKLAQLEKIKEQANLIQKGILEGLEPAYQKAITNLEATRREWFLAETSLYQMALKNFNTAKAEYLKYRKEIAESENVTDEMKAELERLDGVVDGFETALRGAYRNAMNAMDLVKNTLTEAYQAVVTAVSEMGASMDIVSDNLTTAITDFTTKFESDYATYKDNANKIIADFKAGINPQE